MSVHLDSGAVRNWEPGHAVGDGPAHALCEPRHRRQVKA